ncbi:zinc ribbon domain-containing protein [Microlunatus parietis]|uniref:C4-type zinc ribbon domain-containing protein n=1 Tax=Microlunatus parietis TaxID=682979 RepID=A0A7Y9I4Q6_9ACTN|nr:C4-type zinc ribbon domain-containing protein [Microlunatus parietis]NYE70235.1 hypothetical protein [Microlunatus parietis]
MLALQQIDSALAQLLHRRKTLPEHDQLAAAERERDEAEAALVQAETEVSDLSADQAKAESDLEPVRQRLARDEARIADGSVSDPKQLESLVAEVGHLRKRISDLEDAELEVMEKLETATARADELRNAADKIRSEVERLTGERDTKVAAINAEAAGRKAERTAAQPQLPADLLALYEKVRASHSGVGAAELRNRRCTGCQLEINAAELRQFAAAPEDEVLRCEECSRILVRTENSGL